MSLKTVFKTMKREGYIVKDLDKYLMSLADTDSDRAIDVNAPSQLGQCLRSRYYARTGAERDGCSIDPRARRILDNGTGVHVRLQGYLKEQGMLLIDEVPVLNVASNIQGHTDGILKLSPVELGILEIKSINSNGFNALKTAKPEHKIQGLIYIYCVEERRKALFDLYAGDLKKFEKDEKKRYDTYSSYYQHLQSGSKFTREEKIKYQCDLHNAIDTLLVTLKKPITKAVFLYECKDTQELKEFTISSEEAESKVILKQTLEDCNKLNECVKSGKIPNREGKTKNDGVCRWCAFKTECWG